MSAVKTTKNQRKKVSSKTSSSSKSKSISSNTNNKKLQSKPIDSIIAMKEFDIVDASDVKYTNCFNNMEFVEEKSNNNLISFLENENKNLKMENNNLELKINDLSAKCIALEKTLSMNEENNKINNNNNDDISILKNNEIHLNNQINHLNQVNKNLNDEINKLKEIINNQNVENINNNSQKNTNTPPPINGVDNSNLNNEQLIEKQKIWDTQKKQLEDKIESLTIELESERQQLINKLQAKSKQAQELIDQKLAALDEENKEKINNIKIKVYEDIISKFLDPINLFEQTILSSMNNPAISNYLQGFNMIVNMFKDNLSMLGADEIDVKVGDEFNPNWMSAFDTIEGSDVAPNHVVKIVSKGFVFNGKVIKFASVVVAK